MIRGWTRADVFVPLERRPDADRGSHEIPVIGRLRPGVTFQAARSDLGSVAQRLAELYPEDDEGMGIRMDPSSRWIADDTLRRALWILMGGAGLLLLIACVNLANLMLARATGQWREQALRVALGASRARIVRLALTESMSIGLCGALLGVGLAWALTRLLRAFDPGDIPRLADVTIDGPVLAFTAAVALLTGLITGLVPALRTPNRDVVSVIREGERSVMGNRRQGRLRSMLVAAEIAMSLVLLVGAGLLLRSFTEVVGADRGFRTENRLFFEVTLPSSSYSADGGVRPTQFRSDFLSRIRSSGAVISAAAIGHRPMRGKGVGMGFGAADQRSPSESDQAVRWASWRLITRDYFRTMGVPLLAGRDSTERDLRGDPWRVIISRRVAQELWPGENAVGRRINLWQDDERQAEVIGVVDDMLDWGLELGPTYAVYIPFYGAEWQDAHFVVQTTASPTAVVPTLRSILAEIDPNVPLSDVQTLDEMIGANVASRKFTMMLLAAFAGVALLLALAGVYGVLSYTVARRRSEIGIRLALGATRAGILRLIVRQGMVPVVVGLVFGVLGARALSELLSSLLFGVTPADVRTYMAVAAVLAAAAVLSCIVPARNAVQLDVISALREE
ncbi:MAG: ADOP family duplicated permease [Longimicrobiales bacterium]